jgi:hypothetical protein
MKVRACVVDVLVVIAGGDSVVIIITADYISVSVRSDVMIIISGASIYNDYDCDYY